MQRTRSVARFLATFLPSTPIAISLAYAAVGVVWILLTDRIRGGGVFFQTTKGVLFVCITALALYALLSRRRVIRTDEIDQLTHSLHEIKAAQTALTQSDARLRRLIDASLDAVVTVALDDLVLEWNEEAERLFGWTRAEAIGESLAELIVPPARHESYRQMLARAAAVETKGLPARRYETRAVDRLDREFSVELTVSTVEWGDRLVATMFLRDISDRVRARDEAQLIQAVVNAAPFAIISIDERGSVLSWNPAAEDMYGWTADEMRGRSAAHLFPDDSGELAPLLDRIRLGAHVESEQGVFRRRDGRPIAVVWTLAALPPVGGVQRSALLCADLSEQQHLERRLSDAEYLASLGRLAGTVAHEFNNVLMGIQSFAEVIGKRAPANESIDRAVGQIRLGVQRGRRITEDILRFTRAAVTPSLQAIHLDDWLPTIEHDLNALVAPDVTVKIETEAPGLTVIGDPGQLYQVVTNLVLNAKDAMPGGGRITIRCRPCEPVTGTRDSCVEIAVCDTGTGMADDAAAHAFEPLFTTKRDGTGLGLAVVQKIVRAHAGEVSFETAAGEGTTFRIKLPARLETERFQVPPPSERSFSPHRILLVEDDIAVATGLADVLRSYDMTVDVLHSGVEVIQAIERFKPDVVVLDVGLPDRDGVAVFHDVAGAHPDLPVLFSTGHADEARLEGPLSRRNVGFLRKPYPIETLLEEIEGLVRPSTLDVRP